MKFFNKTLQNQLLNDIKDGKISLVQIETMIEIIGPTLAVQEKQQEQVRKVITILSATWKAAMFEASKCCWKAFEVWIAASTLMRESDLNARCN
jgi:hypothetical protein